MFVEPFKAKLKTMRISSNGHRFVISFKTYKNTQKSLMFYHISNYVNIKVYFSPLCRIFTLVKDINKNDFSKQLVQPFFDFRIPF